jgi:hypothetical protein
MGRRRENLGFSRPKSEPSRTRTMREASDGDESLQARGRDEELTVTNLPLGSLAQLAEQGTLNPKVIGSIPIRPTDSAVFPLSLAGLGPVCLPAPALGHKTNHVMDNPDNHLDPVAPGL